MVANGVTTVRFMIGTPELLSLRSRSANGEIDAPTIFVASPHLTGREQGNDFVVNTPEEAREAVRKSKAAGYDFIKVTTFVKPEVYEAAVYEAAKQTSASSVMRTAGSSVSSAPGKRNSRSSTSMDTWSCCFVTMHR
jgi:L-alanine-DL-glutamate epimerase-like enolase superfamily enzyme